MEIAFSTFSIFPHSLLIPTSPPTFFFFLNKSKWREEEYSGCTCLYFPETGTSRIGLSSVSSKGQPLIIRLNPVLWNGAAGSQLGWVGQQD